MAYFTCRYFQGIKKIRYNSLISKLEDNQQLRFGHSSASALSACQKLFLFVQFISSSSSCHFSPQRFPKSQPLSYLALPALHLAVLQNQRPRQQDLCYYTSEKMPYPKSTFCRCRQFHHFLRTGKPHLSKSKVLQNKTPR